MGDSDCSKFEELPLVLVSDWGYRRGVPERLEPLTPALGKKDILPGSSQKGGGALGLDAEILDPKKVHKGDPYDLPEFEILGVPLPPKWVRPSRNFSQRRPCIL